MRSDDHKLSNDWSSRPGAALAMGRTAMWAGAKRGDLSLYRAGKALAEQANAELDRRAALAAKSVKTRPA